MTEEEKKERSRVKARAAEKRYRERHPEKVRARALKYRAANSEKYVAGQRAWFTANKERRREYHRTRAKRLRRDNPYFKLCCTLRTRLHRAVRDQGATKGAKTFELLGCRGPELVSYLEKRFRPGMTWQNHGTVWEIDHIIPCAAFDLTLPDQQKACFRYTNLQPLFSEENRSKGARLSGATK